MGPRYVLELEMTAPISSFGTCLRGPVESGFERNVVETFVATIKIKVYKKRVQIALPQVIEKQLKEIDRQIFHGAASRKENKVGAMKSCPANCKPEASK